MLNTANAVIGKVRRCGAWTGSVTGGAAIAIVIVASLANSPFVFGQSIANSTSAQPSTVHVDVTPGHAINSFDPDSALGSSIDVLSRAGIDTVFTPHIIQESLSAGWGPIPTAITANSAWPHGIGPKTERGVTPLTSADTLPGAQNSKSRSVTYSRILCLTGDSPRAAIVRSWVPISAIGKAIPISPVSSRGKAILCTRNGW